MNLNVLIRGQSNALMMMESNGWAGSDAIIKKTQQLLGFDGVTDKVVLEYSSAGAANTVNSGTAFLKDWIKPTADGSGWQVNGLEQGLLNFIGNLPAAQKAQPTAVVWLHSEYDSTNGGLTPQYWESGVRYDANLVRQAFGKSAADLPYLFVSAIPYWGTEQGHQAIRQGMEHLAADAAFNGGIAARGLDIDMSNDNTDGNWNTVDYGGPHMSAADSLLMANRVAQSLAQEWAEYAKPGSPVALAGGQVDNLGPQVIQATPVGSNQIAVKVSFDAASSLAALDPDAAAGSGWSVRSGSGTVTATAAQVTGADTLLLIFGGAVPAGGKLYYGYGYGMLDGASGGGSGNAVYDNKGMPIWVSADGLAVNGTAVAPAQPSTPSAPVAPEPAPTTPAAPAAPSTPVVPSTDWAVISQVVQEFYDAHGYWASYEDILAQQQPATPAPEAPVVTSPAPVAPEPAPTTPTPSTPVTPSTDWAVISRVVQEFYDTHGYWASYEDILAQQQPATPAPTPPVVTNPAPMAPEPAPTTPAAPAAPSTPVVPSTDWAVISQVVQEFYDTHGYWASYEDILAQQQPATPAPEAPASPAETAIAGAAKTLLGANPPDIFTFHDQSPVSTAVSGVTQTSTVTGLLMSGSASADTLTGGTGRDSINGNDGKDVISGGAGTDQLFGNGGDDVLKGELGNDFLNGGPGNDVLTGGAGVDLFGFWAAQGADRATDFAPGTDKLRLVGMTAADIGIATHAEAGVSGTLVTFDAGGSVFLAGVASLGSGDILFV